MLQHRVGAVQTEHGVAKVVQDARRVDADPRREDGRAVLRELVGVRVLIRIVGGDRDAAGADAAAAAEAGVGIEGDVAVLVSPCPEVHVGDDPKTEPRAWGLSGSSAMPVAEKSWWCDISTVPRPALSSMILSLCHWTSEA